MKFNAALVFSYMSAQSEISAFYLPSMGLDGIRFEMVAILNMDGYEASPLAYNDRCHKFIQRATSRRTFGKLAK